MNGQPAAPDRPARSHPGPSGSARPVGDITYLDTGEGWLYLVTVIDVATRRARGLATLRQV